MDQETGQKECCIFRSVSSTVSELLIENWKVFRSIFGKFYFFVLFLKNHKRYRLDTYYQKCRSGSEVKGMLHFQTSISNGYGAIQRQLEAFCSILEIFAYISGAVWNSKNSRGRGHKFRSRQFQRALICQNRLRNKGCRRATDRDETPSGQLAEVGPSVNLGNRTKQSWTLVTRRKAGWREWRPERERERNELYWKKKRNLP